MEIKLKLKIPGAKRATDTRNGFWQEYCQRSGLPFDEDGDLRERYDGAYSSERLEALVRARFVSRLNDALSYRFSRKYDGPQGSARSESPFDNVILKFIRFDYNSLEVFLKVLGLDDGSLLPLLCGALEVYAPDAFGNSMPGNGVELVASADFEDSSLTRDCDRAAQRERRGRESRPDKNGREFVMGRLWGILNGSLIVPVILALVVLYQLSTSLDRERDELGKERLLLSSERGVLLQNLMQQESILVQMLRDTTRGSKS